MRGADRRPDGLRIDQARGLVDVAQDRRRAGVHRAERRGDERVPGDDHLITRADARGPQHERESRRSRRDTHAFAGLAVVGELRLELLHFGSERVCARSEQAGKRLRQFLFDVFVLLVECDEAHGVPLRPRV